MISPTKSASALHVWAIGYVAFHAILSVLPVQASERVLTFRPDNPIGLVTVSNTPWYEGKHLTFDQSYRATYRAQERVAVQVDGFVGLELSNSGSQDLSFLAALPVNVLNSLTIRGASLNRDEMQQIVRLKSLVKLEFSQCDFSPDAFDGLDSIPELLSLTVSHRGGLDGGRGIARWIAALPKLEVLFSTPALNVRSYREIGDHPTLTTTNAQLGADADQVLASLARLPSLKALSFSANEEATTEQLKGLGDLGGIERVRWFGGQVEGEVLRSLAKHNQLERLTLAHFAPGDGVLDGIKSLTQLTHLDVIPSEYDPARFADLPACLIELPRLQHWPTLYNVDSNMLQWLVSRREIQSLTLDGVAKDVTTDQLSQLGRLTNLRRLDLRGVPVRDDWLANLSDLTELQYINLFDTGVTGSGFATLRHLTKLREIHLFYSSVDDAWIRPDVSTLSSLPALENLEIGGVTFGPQDIESLQACKSLKRLRLWGGGFSDDSTAAWISELPNLVDLTLSENCVVTDSGARSLAKLDKLQRLIVGGFLTRAGGMELASIPTLRLLAIQSSNISESDAAQLRDVAPGLPFLSIRPYAGSLVIGVDGLLRKISRGNSLVIAGDDGLLRQQSADNSSLRARMDVLEGKPAPALDVESPTSPTHFNWSMMRGQVILLDFWGTWCGPCRKQLPTLQQLYSKYHAKGFNIVGVHTQHGAEQIGEFLEQKPLQWKTFVDSKGTTAASYVVEHYPSLFLVDRQGVLRVALVHELGLEKAIVTLLEE